MLVTQVPQWMVIYGDIQTCGLIRGIAEHMKKTVYSTKVPHMGNISKLQAIYLFLDIGRRRSAHMQKYP